MLARVVVAISSFAIVAAFICPASAEHRQPRSFSGGASMANPVVVHDVEKKKEIQIDDDDLRAQLKPGNAEKDSNSTEERTKVIGKPQRRSFSGGAPGAALRVVRGNDK